MGGQRTRRSRLHGSVRLTDPNRMVARGGAVVVLVVRFSSSGGFGLGGPTPRRRWNRRSQRPEPERTATMMNSCGRRFLALLPLSILLACWSSGAAQPPERLGPPTAVAAPAALDLASCVHLALEGHPKVQAARASLA